MNLIKCVLFSLLFLLAISTSAKAQEVIMGEVSTENIVEGKLAVYLPHSTSKKQIQEQLTKLNIKILDYHMKNGRMVISKGVTDEIEDLFKNSPLVTTVDTSRFDYARVIDDRLESTNNFTAEQKKTLERLKETAAEKHLIVNFKMDVDKDTAVRFLMKIKDKLEYKLDFSPRYIIVDIPKGQEEEYENKLNDLSSVDFVTYVAEHIDQNN